MQDDKQKEPEDGKQKELAPTKPVANKPSKLDRRVKEFIDLVCNVNMMQQMMMEIGQCSHRSLHVIFKDVRCVRLLI